MAFRVEITDEAQRDARSILDWLISEQAGKSGLEWFQGLENAIASLAELPVRCALAPENASASFEVRHLLYGRKPHVYRILFTVESNRVVILHIWHGRRRPAPMQ